MLFALFKTNHFVGFSLDETKLLEAACKKAWRSMGASFAGKFEEEDVGGVVVFVKVEYLRWTTVEFVYVDRGAQFTVALREALHKELASVVKTPPLINMCPTSAECWFAPNMGGPGENCVDSWAPTAS